MDNPDEFKLRNLSRRHLAEIHVYEMIQISAKCGDMFDLVQGFYGRKVAMQNGLVSFHTSTF